MEINKAYNTRIAELNNEKAPLKPAAPEKVTTVKANQAINISSDWQLVENGLEKLQQVNDVDLAKVQALRESLQQGNFKIDLSQVSEKMINQHG